MSTFQPYNPTPGSNSSTGWFSGVSNLFAGIGGLLGGGPSSTPAVSPGFSAGQAIGAAIPAGTPENNPANAPTWASFAKWGAAYALFAVVMLGMSESDKYGDAATAMVWVIAFGATLYWWPSLDVSLAELLGKSTVLSKSG